MPHSLRPIFYWPKLVLPENGVMLDFSTVSILCEILTSEQSVLCMVYDKKNTMIDFNSNMNIEGVLRLDTKSRI